MIDGFYRAFEDKHRGSLDMIKQRQSVYLPLIQPLIELYPQAPAIDLGCGRGEWLELLTENGFQAFGIDLDEGMLAECRQRGLNVKTEDALVALKSLSDNSQAIVSGFHFAEHIPFEVLQGVVQEALRVLLPAGLLILETPNPENILVGTSNFYLDPSHLRPLPPPLMEFLPEYYGFHRIKVLRLQEPKGLDLNRHYSIYDVFGNVSPDYAVVAQKAASYDILQLVSSALEKDLGVTLGKASTKYDAQLRDSLGALTTEISVAKNEYFHMFKAAKEEINQTKLNLDIAKNESFHMFKAAKHEAVQALLDLDARYDRRIRLVEAHQQRIQDHLTLIEARRLKPRVKRWIKRLVFPVLRKTQSLLNRHVGLHSFLIKVSEKLGIFDVLHRILNLGANANGSTETSESFDAPVTGATSEAEGGLNAVQVIAADEPEPVQQIFNELDLAIQKIEKH